MARYVTLTYALAPVVLAQLEATSDLRVLGDQTTDLSDTGQALRPVDEPGNLMGAIFAQWHDAVTVSPQPAAEFIQKFSTQPTETRQKTIEDPHHTLATGECGRYFQNPPGSTYVYDGFLLVAPNQDDLEEFFCWADTIFT